MVDAIDGMTEGNGRSDSNDPSDSAGGLVDGNNAEEGPQGSEQGAYSQEELDLSCAGDSIL